MSRSGFSAGGVNGYENGVTEKSRRFSLSGQRAAPLPRPVGIRDAPGMPGLRAAQ